MVAEQKRFTAILPQALWRAEQVRVNESDAAAAMGVSLSQLMERAGAASFELLHTRWPQAKRLLVLAGHGNNGGDAYVVARLALEAGLTVQLVQIGDAKTLPAPADNARDSWLQLGGVIDSEQQADFDADLIVDGLLGTGLTGPVNATYMALIERINQSGCPVLALDLPSGLDADSGAVYGAAVQADASIAFVGLKRGLCTGEAVAYCGALYFAGLGIDNAFMRLVNPDWLRVSYLALSVLLPRRALNSHKGDFGRVVLLGGNIGMPGAIRLAAEACLRTGAGLVSVVAHQANLASIGSGRPELMVYGLTDIEPQSRNHLGERLLAASVLVLGPGLGQDCWAQTLFNAALKVEKVKIIDADGLNLLAKQPATSNNWILTPHPGEAARLLGLSVEEVEADRFNAVKALQQRYGGVVVLKGRGTIIYNGEKKMLADVGNPGMASGGMGDLLTGIIAALVAQGLSMMDAAAMGVCIHGSAADMAAKQGERGMLASDLLPYVRRLVNPAGGDVESGNECEW